MTWSAFLVTAVVIILASFLLGAALSWVGVAIAMRRFYRSTTETWMEQARFAFPARQRMTLDAVMIPVTLGFLLFVCLVSDVGSMAAPLAVLGAFGAFLGVLKVGQGFERRICRTVSGKPLTGVALRTIILLPTMFTFGFVVALIPTRWGNLALVVLVLGAVLQTFQTAGGWFFLLQQFGLTRPPTPRLVDIIEHISTKMGVQPRYTLVLSSPNANAIAFPLSRLLVFTEPLLDHLDDEEVASIVAHELGHLSEPRSVFFSRMFASYFLLIILAGIPLGGSYGLLAALIPLGLSLTLLTLFKRVARRMEERSDRLGKEMDRDSESTYARALAALYEQNLVPAVTRSKAYSPPASLRPPHCCWGTPNLRSARPSAARFLVRNTFLPSAILLVLVCLPEREQRKVSHSSLYEERGHPGASSRLSGRSLRSCKSFARIRKNDCGPVSRGVRSQAVPPSRDLRI